MYPSITQGHMYSQASYQPAMLAQDYRVNPRSLYGTYRVPGVGTNPQLISSESVYPGVVQYPSEMSQQQIMGMSSNTSRARVVPTNTGAPHIRPADCGSISSQSSSISNPNDVSLYSHSSNPVARPPQLVYENLTNSIITLPPRQLLPPPLDVSLLYCDGCDMLYSVEF